MVYVIISSNNYLSRNVLSSPSGGFWVDILQQRSLGSKNYSQTISAQPVLNEFQQNANSKSTHLSKLLILQDTQSSSLRMSHVLGPQYQNCPSLRLQFQSLLMRKFWSVM
ncbi:Hypothetical_protein [Hexamita inflata]|uniref:Hypothetical_protein n=1 Tax=Hexamita inflata TaxID=28002 RepID=A0AA86QS00_9EUKA|nr:Hypothetical protein HINF_LOCUS52564 [Hexamita inflata]